MKIVRLRFRRADRNGHYTARFDRNHIVLVLQKYMPRENDHRLSGAELADLKNDAHFPEEITFREIFKQMRLKGKVRIDGRETYAIEAIPYEGSPQTIYFDAKTWFRVRIDSIRHTEQGSQASQCYLDDYRKIDSSGIKYPFKIRSRVANLTVIGHVKEVRLNVPVDQNLFSPPSFKLKIQR